MEAVEERLYLTWKQISKTRKKLFNSHYNRIFITFFYYRLKSKVPDGDLNWQPTSY